MKKYSTERLFGDVYLATTSSSANSNGTTGRIGYALSDGIVHVAFVCMTIRVYSKTLVLGPTTRNARAGSQSAIHPKLTGRRWARVTYRTHGHRRAARNNSSPFKKRRVLAPCVSENALGPVDDHQFGSSIR
jgi:hypothetical protein